MAASEGGSGGSGGDGDWSDTSTQYRAYERPNIADGAGEAEPEFLDDLDPGGMDSDGGSGEN
jgi:hypothetical protein